MTVTANPRVPAAERIAVRCVDSDVHPAPRSGELGQYIPEPWRSKYFGTHKVGDQIYYDAPDYAHSYAMRLDAFPPDGEFACSDPDLAFKQLIMEAGADICHPGARRLSGADSRGQPRNELRAERLAGQPLARQPQQLARAVARVDLPGHRGTGEERRGDRALGRPSVHVADPDQGRAAPVLGQPQVRRHLGGGHQARHPRQLPSVAQPLRRAADAAGRACPVTTTTSWSPTRCWRRTR